MLIKTVILKEVDLKKLLKKRKITMTELAKRSGISQPSISNYERGFRICSNEIWDKIKKVLDEKI